jgi:hypothetical protein
MNFPSGRNPSAPAAITIKPDTDNAEPPIVMVVAP